MQRGVKRRRSMKFSDKVHPMMGVVSVLIAVVSTVIIISLFVVSGNSGGKAGIFIGEIGILGLFLSIGGLVAACLSLKIQEIQYFFPITGAVMNGLLTILYILIYIMGAFL